MKKRNRAGRTGKKQSPGKTIPGTRLSINYPLLTPAAIFVLALLIRVIYLFQSQANPQFDTPLMDPGYHDEWAWQLARGVWEGQGPFFRAPLYPLFLGLVYSLFGHDFIAPRLIQAILGSGSCVLIYLIGVRLFNTRTGLIAALMMAMYGTLIYFDNELLIPVLFIFLILVFFQFFLMALDQGRHRILFSAACGLCLGLAAITRPNILVILPALIWAVLPISKINFPRRALLVLLLTALIPVFIVTGYNFIIGDDAVFIASQGGVNFYIGNNELSDGRTAIVPGTRADWWGGRFDTIKLAEEVAGHKLKDSEVSNYWFSRGVEFIRSNPGAWFNLTMRKVGMFWTGAEIGNNSSINYLMSYAPIMNWLWFGFGLIAPLGLAGFVIAFKQRRHLALLPGIFIVLYMAGIVIFFVCARFRMPVIPWLILFAAYGVDSCIAFWRSGRHKELILPVMVFSVAALAVNIPARGHQENLAQAKFHDGIAWKKKGEHHEAMLALTEALRLNPQLAGARSNLANLLSSNGNSDEARLAYEEAIDSDPENANTHANLASFHLAAADLTLAEESVNNALAIDSDCSEALRILGVIREREGKLAEARLAYEHALRFTHERHRLENNLGTLSMAEGKVDEAAVHLQKAVELDPAYALAWTNLGALYANTGQLANAVAALKRSVEIEPDSRQVWSMLAQVYDAMGNQVEADAARQAHSAR